MAYYYPYGDSDELNLDWFINEFQRLASTVENLEARVEELEREVSTNGV